MAEPQDAAISLQLASEIVQEEYMPSFDEQYQKVLTNVTNKCFQPNPQVVVGDGLTMQYELGPADSVRFSNNPVGDIANAQRIDPGKIKIRWNEDDLTAHDFTQVTARCQFSIYTIENGSDGTIVDLAQRIYKSIIPDFDTKMAVLRNAPKTGQLCLVNGTPKQADMPAWADCTATPTNATGVCFKIDTGSISVLRPNGHYDIIRPATSTVPAFVVAGNLRCMDIPNFVEKSARLEYMSTGATGELSTGNIANIADNDIVVYSGSYNKGIYSFRSYFGAPTEGETFMCGVDRTDSGYGWMNPQRVDAGSGKLTKTLFNTMAQAMGFIGEDATSAVAVKCDPTQFDAIRNELGEESFIEIPTSDDRSKRFMNFGSIGLNYQHPTFGTVKILADPLALPTSVDFIVNGTWKTLSYAWKGLRILDGDNGHWYRMNQSTPNTGRGLFLAADWAGNIADFGTMPWKNGTIHSLALPA